MKHSKTGIFLMELIVGVLFFSLASALCIQIFVKAKQMNNESIQKSHASRIASNMIELYKSHELEDDNILYFDNNAMPTQQKDFYCVTLDVIDDVLKIKVTYDDKLVYDLDYYHYQQKTFEKDVES